MRTLSQNLCYIVNESERGDVIFGIVENVGKPKNAGKPKNMIYTYVAEVSFILRYKGDTEGYIETARRGIQIWFASPPYEKSYRLEAEEGKKNPYETWEEIRKHYNFSDKFNKKPN